MISYGYEKYIKEVISEYIREHNSLPQKMDLKDISTEPLISEYGSWRNVLISFGFLEHETPEMVFEKLKKLQLELNNSPTLIDLKNNDINVRPLIKKYGSWGNVKKELKEYLPEKYIYKRKDKIEERIKEDELKIIELTKELMKVPSANDVRKKKININRILGKYRTWENAKKELMLEKVLRENRH